MNNDLVSFESLTPSYGLHSTAQLFFLNLNYGLTHESITIKHQIDQRHKYKTNTPAVCSGLSVHETNIATIGEDGR